MASARDRVDMLTRESPMTPDGAESTVRAIDAWFIHDDVRSDLETLVLHLSGNGYDDTDIVLGISALGRAMHRRDTHRGKRDPSLT